MGAGFFLLKIKININIRLEKMKIDKNANSIGLIFSSSIKLHIFNAAPAINAKTGYSCIIVFPAIKTYISKLLKLFIFNW